MFERMKTWRKVAARLRLQDANRKSKTLKGTSDSPGQSQFPGEVALGVMARGDFFQRRFHLSANLLGILAARVEVTARRRIGRVGNFASEEDTFLPWPRVWARDG